MPHEKLTAPPLSYYSRSQDGLWIKAERVPSAVRVYWQARTRMDGGHLVELDAQGEEYRRTPAIGAEYPDPWQLAGEIPAGHAVLELSGLQDFDWFQFGLMRHAAGLIALGYGDTPEEVMEWFEDPRAGDYVRKGEYRVVGPERKPFFGLGGAKLMLDDRWPEEGEPTDDLSGTVIVQEGNEFPFAFQLSDVLAAFTIATVPV